MPYDPSQEPIFPPELKVNDNDLHVKLRASGLLFQTETFLGPMREFIDVLYICCRRETALFKPHYATKTTK